MIQVHLDLNNYDLGHVIRLVAGLAASHHTEITPCVRRGPPNGAHYAWSAKALLLLEGSWNLCETLLVNRISNGVILWNSIFMNDAKEVRFVNRLGF